MSKTETLTTGFMIFSLTLLCACSDNEVSQETETVLRPVRMVIVENQSVLNTREFAGVVDAERKVDLAFRVGGTLEELPVLEGDQVTEGQLLASLDKTDFEIQLRGVEADYMRSKAEYERAETLVARELIARSEYERLQAQFFVAEAQLERAQQDLEYSTLYAPFDGFLSRRYVENLSEIAPRSPVLALFDLNTLVVEINVPESVMIAAQREGIRPDMYAVFEGREDEQYPLQIREIAGQPDSGTQTYPVTLSLPPITDINILPGMSAVVGVRPFNRPGNVLNVAYLPPQAVLEDAEGRYVFVAELAGNDEAADSAVIVRRNVSVGDISNFGIQVTEGLDTGEAVVTAGMRQLAEGQHVLLMD